MALVTFRNECNFAAHLHMRVGPIGVPPDDRGSSNTVVDSGESTDVNVEEGDVWYCYGRQQVGGDDNPELCNARGGTTVILDGTGPCFVHN